MIRKTAASSTEIFTQWTCRICVRDNRLYIQCCIRSLDRRSSESCDGCLYGDSLDLREVTDNAVNVGVLTLAVMSVYVSVCLLWPCLLQRLRQLTIVSLFLVDVRCK